MEGEIHPSFLKRIESALLLSASKEEFESSHAYKSYIESNECKEGEWMERLKRKFSQGMVGYKHWLHD